MVVDWTTLFQGFWLGAGFWMATVGAFVFFVIVTVVTSVLIGIFDSFLAKKGGPDGKQ